MIYRRGSGQPTRNVPTSLAERSSFVLTNSEILQLARSACVIERPLWLPDGHRVGEGRGERGEAFYCPGAPPRPCSRVRKPTHAADLPRRAQGPEADLKGLEHRRRRSFQGLSASSRLPRISTASCRRGACDDHHRSRLGADHETSSSDRYRSRRAHVACRHRQPRAWFPAIVGTGNATEVLHQEQDVTVSCAEGDEGFVYEGIAEVVIEEMDVAHLRATTKIMLNMANPAAHFAGGGCRRTGWGLPGWSSYRQSGQGASDGACPFRRADR